MVLFAKSAARNPGTSAPTLAKLARTTDLAVLELVAQNPSTPPDALRHLAHSQPPSVRCAVASNPSTPADVLDTILATSGVTESETVAVAGNEATSATTLTRLSKSKTQTVTLAVAGNRATPLSVRADLFDSPALRDVLIRTPYLDGTSSVRIASAEAYHGSANVQRLLTHDPDPKVRRAIASARNAPAEVLDILVEDPVAIVSELALARRSTDATVLSRLKDTDDIAVLSHLFRNSDTPPDVRLAVARRILLATDDETANAIAQDERMPADVLEQLARRSSAHIRASIGRNPSTPVTVVHTLTSDPDDGVRGAAAASTHLSLTMLVRLAADANAAVRVAIAGNPSTPREILMRLAADKDGAVQVKVAQHHAADPAALQRIVESHSEGRADHAFALRTGGYSDPLLEVARNPRTPPQALRDLENRRKEEVRAHGGTWGTVQARQKQEELEDSWFLVQIEVARNPSTPADLLLELTRELLDEQKKEKSRTVKGRTKERERLLDAIVANPPTPASVLSLLKDGSWVASRTTWRDYREDGHSFTEEIVDLGATQAAMKNAARKVERRLSQIAWGENMSSADRLKFAKSEGTDPPILSELASDGDAHVRKSVVTNRFTPPDAFLRLASDTSVDVRLAAAKASHVDRAFADAFEILAQDDAAEVRAALITNDKVFWDILSSETRDRVAFDPEPAVRDALVRSFAATQKWEARLSEAALAQLLDHGDASIWRTLAAHRNTPKPILVRLIGMGDAETLCLIADRYKADPDLLVQLAKSSDPEVLSRVAAQASGRKVARTLARNPRVPADDLAMLAASESDSDTLLSLATNPSLPESALLDFALGSSSRRVRLAALSGRLKVLEVIAENPSAPRDVIEHLASRNEASIRERLLVNESTPPEVLVRLIDTGTAATGPSVPYALPDAWDTDAG